MLTPQPPPEWLIHNSAEWWRYLDDCRAIAQGTLGNPHEPADYPVLISSRWVIERDYVRNEDWPGWRHTVITQDEAYRLYRRAREILDMFP